MRRGEQIPKPNLTARDEHPSSASLRPLPSITRLSLAGRGAPRSMGSVGPSAACAGATGPRLVPSRRRVRPSRSSLGRPLKRATSSRFPFWSASDGHTRFECCPRLRCRHRIPSRRTAHGRDSINDPPDSRRLIRSSRHSSTIGPDRPRSQEAQIVQSCMNLDDFLPRFASRFDRL